MAGAGGDIGYKNEQGKVFCNRSILLSAINLATKEIKGVADMCKNFGSGFNKLVGKKDYEGVKVNFGKDGLDIDIFIKVFSNVSVPDVASRIQENVKNAVLSLMNTVVKSINVNVAECVLVREF